MLDSDLSPVTSKNKKEVSLSALHQLDADEVLAIRGNLQSARSVADGPPRRCLPESLCLEIETLLELLELEMRLQEQSDSEN